jgi:hypothetical protein
MGEELNGVKRTGFVGGSVTVSKGMRIHRGVDDTQIAEWYDEEIAAIGEAQKTLQTGRARAVGIWRLTARHLLPDGKWVAVFILNELVAQGAERPIVGLT